MHHQTEPIYAVLKSMLKKRRITYADLADMIDSTESSIKNIFHKRSLDLNKLAIICEALEITLMDLFEASANFEEGEFSFSEEAETYMVESPSHYNFFSEIYFGRKSLRTVQTEHKLSNTSIDKYLKDLEDLGVIERGSERNFRFLCRGQLRWRHKGPWMQKHYKKVSTKQAETICDEHAKEESWSNFGLIHLSEKEFETMKYDMGEVVDKYKRKSYQRHLRPGKERLIDVCWNFMILNQILDIHTSKIKNID